MIKLGRIDEWRARLLAENQQGNLLKMLAKLLTGKVSRKTWRLRIRTCLRCPIYDRQKKACRSALPWLRHLGCGCYVPFLAWARRPYKKGCWGRTNIGDDFGWGPGDNPADHSKE